MRGGVFGRDYRYYLLDGYARDDALSLIRLQDICSYCNYLCISAPQSHFEHKVKCVDPCFGIGLYSRLRELCGAGHGPPSLAEDDDEDSS